MIIVEADMWQCIYMITGFLDAIVHLSKIDEMMKEEANNLREIIEILHLKHKEYADEIQTYVRSHLMDQAEIKRLSGYCWNISCDVAVLEDYYYI